MLRNQQAIVLNVPPGSRMWLTQVKLQPQRGYHWCWAACISMVLRGLGLKKGSGQCDIAATALQSNPYCMPPCDNRLNALPCCDVVYLVDQIATLWSQSFQIQAVPTPMAVDWKKVCCELNAGNPVQIFLGTGSEAGAAGHLVLIIDAVEDAMGNRKVLIADPSTGIQETSPKDFDALRQRLSWGEWTWTWTNLRF